MSMADMLTYSAFGNEMLSLMMGIQDIIKYSFFKEDIPKIDFRCSCSLGIFKWTMMSFRFKNARATCQKKMNVIFQEFIRDFIQVYIDNGLGS